MENENEGFFNSDSGNGINRNNSILIGIAAVLALVVVYLWWSTSGLSSTLSRQKNQISSLQADSLNIRSQLDTSEVQKVKLREQADSLASEKEKLEKQKDSVNRLLYAARNNSRVSQAELTKLKKQLKDVTDKLNDIQKKYDELVAMSGSNLDEYRNQIDMLNGQVKTLENENGQLRTQLGKYEGEADNKKALFATGVSASAIYLDRKKKPQPTTQPKKVEQIELNFRLSRATREGEALELKLYDENNKEVTITPKAKNDANSSRATVGKKVYIEAQQGYKYSKGVYTIKIFSSTEDGVGSTEIGSTTFELR
jgi:chromosome segregation ATPase